MVEKNDILIAKKRIEKTLWDFVNNQASGKVCVDWTEYDHLFALIGSGGFQDMNIVDRLDMVWDYLRQNLTSDDLRYLSHVEPMDLDEYSARTREV